MDFDANLFLNFVPIIATATLTFITCVTICFRLKNRWPVKVNCWFCNGNTKVHKQSLDWWICPHCEQYNGFSKDGDYNYEIPEQYKVAKKMNIKNQSYCQKAEFPKNRNSLCKECNKKEELKLLKLRELEDSTDVYSNKRFEIFEKNFEKKYPLCLNCQSTVQNILYKQALWLTQYKMLLFKQKPIKRIIENREKIEKILRIVLSILASVAIYFTEVWYLPLCGIVFQLAACLASPVGTRQSDIFPLLGWICLLWVNVFSTTAILKMFKIYINNNYTSIDDNTYRYFIITLGTAVGLANLKFQSYKTIANASLSFKKLESPKRNISTSRSPSPETVSLLTEKTISNKEPIRNCNSPVNITDTLITPTVVETPIPLKLTNCSQWSPEDKYFSQKHVTSRISNFSPNIDNSASKTFINQTYSLNDSLSSLNSLSLGTQPKSSSPNSPKVFETKVYGTTSPDLFLKNNRYVQKRSILAPPKLRSVTQTSWVAGGYWQSGMDVPTLSRSSSQSSGFGSSSSNYGPSREPSIHEFDQCSILSDQYYFARPESPLSTKNTTILKKRNNHCSSQCLQINDTKCNTETLQYHLRSDSQCNGHTTVITNPIWLSALLCGSLVFNMVVLCTILLR